MFSSERNSPRRGSDRGSSKIPIPVATTLHNLIIEPPTKEQKWFRPEHDEKLLPKLLLEIVVEDGIVVYSSESEKSVRPKWEHLDERIDLPGEWWFKESVYKSMKLRFTLLQTDSDSDSTFLEVPLCPSILQRLDVVPEALPPNSVLVDFSDGSTRLPNNIFQVLLDSKLTEPPPVEDFSRFEDDAFRFLDQVPETLNSRERSASSLLDPEHNSDSSTTNLAAEKPDESLQSSAQFDQSEQATKKEDLNSEKKFLEALIAQEEAEMERELDALNEEKKLISALLQEAKSINEEIRLVQTETKNQAVELSHDEFKGRAQHIKLLSELRTIYPITLDPQKGWVIRNLRLPVDLYTTVVPEIEISAALGFCCHLIVMMSKYLSVQLRHRIYCNSSRSVIQQDGAAIHPLFTTRGVEREQLDRGLALLDADVDCILMTFSIDFTPRSHILARLKRVYDHIIDGNWSSMDKARFQ